MMMVQWEVRSFYADDVEPPMAPGELAIHTSHKSDLSKDDEVAISVAAKRFGRVEIRKIVDGEPQEWIQVKP